MVTGHPGHDNMTICGDRARGDDNKNNAPQNIPYLLSDNSTLTLGMILLVNFEPVFPGSNLY